MSLMNLMNISIVLEKNQIIDTHYFDNLVL